MNIRVMDCQCPKCGANELHPDSDKLLVRGFKVTDKRGRIWSQCLVCSGYYSTHYSFKTRQITYTETPHNWQREKGWF